MKGTQCSHCPAAASLPKGAQRVLEHMAAHLLFDQKINRFSEPCGLCLRPSTASCIFYLKKAKGADGSVQIHHKKSECSNMLTFSYGIAASSTPSSPCSNVPISCPWCPESAPAIWRYNMASHVKTKHSYVSLPENEFLWKIGGSEKAALKKIWESRNKTKKSRKTKANSQPALVISAAHSSTRSLQ